MIVQSTKTITLQLSQNEAELLREIVGQGKHMQPNTSEEYEFAKKLEKKLEEEL